MSERNLAGAVVRSPRRRSFKRGGLLGHFKRHEGGAVEGLLDTFAFLVGLHHRAIGRCIALHGLGEESPRGVEGLASNHHAEGGSERACGGRGAAPAWNGGGGGQLVQKLIEPARL